MFKLANATLESKGGMYIPDFGVEDQSRFVDDNKGWELFFDAISSAPKNELAHNAVSRLIVSKKVKEEMKEMKHKSILLQDKTAFNNFVEKISGKHAIKKESILSPLVLTRN